MALEIVNMCRAPCLCVSSLPKYPFTHLHLLPCSALITCLCYSIAYAHSFVTCAILGFLVNSRIVVNLSTFTVISLLRFHVAYHYRALVTLNDGMNVNHAVALSCQCFIIISYSCAHVDPSLSNKTATFYFFELETLAIVM